MRFTKLCFIFICAFLSSNIRILAQSDDIEIDDSTSVGWDDGIIIKLRDPVTIKANNLSMVYGDNLPELTYSTEGAALVGQPEIFCEATSTSPVGSYPIIIRKGSVQNSNDSYVNGVLTIIKAPLTISAGNYEKKQYDPMPEFDVSYEGFKNNETKDVLTKQPMLSCEANEDSAPGEYAITVSGAEADNYQIQYVGGKLIVTEPDSYTLTYMVDGEIYQSLSFKYRDSIVPLEAPTKEGYTFSGWSGLPRSMPANDVMVYGKFTVNSYIVRFMYRDEVLYTEEVFYGAPIPLPELYDDYGLLIKWLDVPETMPAHDIVILVDETDAVLNIQGENNDNIKIYDLNGHRLASPQKGINIIRKKDGTSRKVLIK